MISFTAAKFVRLNRFAASAESRSAWPVRLKRKDLLSRTLTLR